jgi:RHS repeat-associated protein
VKWIDEEFEVKEGKDFEWNRKFKGKVFDVESGLMLYRNRYYHTGLGRFVQRDPIGYEAEDVSLYRYVSNMSLAFMDPFGMQTVPLGGGQEAMLAYIKKYILPLKDEAAIRAALNQIRNNLSGKDLRDWVWAEKYAKKRDMVKRLAGRTGGGILLFLSFMETADAAEFSNFWRHKGFREKDCEKSCECAVFNMPVTVPSIWNVFSKIEYGTSTRVDSWDDYGEMTPSECMALEQDLGVSETVRVTGFTIYNILFIRCRWDGKDH